MAKTTGVKYKWIWVKALLLPLLFLGFAVGIIGGALLIGFKAAIEWIDDI
ncbi:hypothetical protein LCGC14_0911100 [marine sediment metagenome]|uniref:Uncharacterized protein n=1 Tax=marine sediment metagenome TaxID=412755 RepID=A0A0F9NYC3_9ZZZZ